MDTSPKFSFPSEADYKRGCMPDGSLLRFPSKELEGEPWLNPLPGKSNVTAIARKQEVPEGCGSIYTPPEGSINFTGVPCPVPEPRDESLEQKFNDSNKALEALTIKRLARSANFTESVIDLGEFAAAMIKAHPELLLEHLAEEAARANRKPAEPREPSEPREKSEPDAEQDLAQAEEICVAMMEEYDEAMSAEEEECADAEPESELKPESVNNACGNEPVPSTDATGPSTGSGQAGGASATEPASPCNVPRVHPRAVQGQYAPATATKRIPPKFRGGIYARCSKLIDQAMRAVPRFNRCVLEFEAAAKKSLERSRQVDLKEEFLADRAHAAVKGWMLFLDKHFRDLGFGGWMPFRFADQWLAFVSLSRKILAANGLITPKGPNHWRKFLEETPEVEDENDPLKLPKSIGPTKKYAEIDSVNEIIERATKKAELNAGFRKRFNERFALGP